MSSNDNLVPTSLIVIWCTKNQKIIAYLNININYNPNNLKLSRPHIILSFGSIPRLLPEFIWGKFHPPRLFFPINSLAMISIPSISVVVPPSKMVQEFTKKKSIDKATYREYVRVDAETV
ncbi:hypothetical protein H8356DRAFT_1353118 [Neocallimastix lanati (nom. inval.)]|nr:hypothetical protein H8356DRAFT_1353118 [Neocallimastix sp. JGI-2020a]